MKSVIEQGLALGVIEKQNDGIFVVSDAASRDQINTYVQFLLDEIHFLNLQRENLEGRVLDDIDLMS